MIQLLNPEVKVPYLHVTRCGFLEMLKKQLLRLRDRTKRMNCAAGIPILQTHELCAGWNHEYHNYGSRKQNEKKRRLGKAQNLQCVRVKKVRADKCD